MQKLSTGNSILDAILVMLLPFLFSHILPHLQEFVSKWVLKARRTSATVTREITFTFKPNTYFDYDGDIPPNHKLQTAILMHLNTLPGFRDSLLTADVKLVKVPKRKEQQEGNASTMSDDGSSSSDSDYYWYPGGCLCNCGDPPSDLSRWPLVSSQHMHVLIAVEQASCHL